MENQINHDKSVNRQILIIIDHLENVARIYLEHLRIQWSNNLIGDHPSPGLDLRDRAQRSVARALWVNARATTLGVANARRASRDETRLEHLGQNDGD